MRQQTDGTQNMSSQALKLLKIVTKRVANRKIHEILDGAPRTDGFDVWLPISTPAFSFDEKVGIASHEAAHIRFRTVFGTSIPALVCPENPRIGHAVLNLLEDARIEALLKLTYFGFWMDLDKANARQIQLNLQRFSADGKEILHSQRTVDLCLYLMSAHSSGHVELLYSDAMRDANGAFKFSAEPLGAFWRAYLAAHAYLHAQLTFPATVIAAKRVIKAVKDLLGDLDARQGETPEGSQGDKKDQRGGGLQDQILPENKQQQGDDPAAPGSGCDQPDLGAREGGERPPQPVNLEGQESAGKRKSPGYERERRSRALADQIISMAAVESGISIDDAEKRDRKVMNEMMKKLKAAGDNTAKLEKALKSLVKREAGRLDDIIKEPGKDEPGHDDGHEEPVVVTDSQDGDEVIVDAIEDIIRLRDFNNIEDPLKEYGAIVRDNGYTIKQLRKALERIKINPLMQRGARRGIICDRDLPRVVSSKGKFNRPFMARYEKRGASLLIVIDESASMSVDDSFKNIMREGDDCCCPRSRTCAVHRECPDRECCDWSGTWPKDLHVECDRLDECPMKASLSVSDEGSGDGDYTKNLPIYIAKKSAIILAEALKETRIDFGVIGFSAIGGKNVIVEKVYKRLDEEANPRKLGSIWVSFESGENRDGTSFQAIASRHLKATQKKLPVMIVISDGEPHHGGTEYVGEVAERMTARAIQALKQNIKLFAISIDQRGRNYLKDIYGSDNYIVLDNPKDITNKLIYLVKNIAAVLC
jgi:hypothetical protein